MAKRLYRPSLTPSLPQAPVRNLQFHIKNPDAITSSTVTFRLKSFAYVDPPLLMHVGFPPQLRVWVIASHAASFFDAARHFFILDGGAGRVHDHTAYKKLLRATQAPH